jgi:hypothetical protein
MSTNDEPMGVKGGNEDSKFFYFVVGVHQKGSSSKKSTTDGSHVLVL